VGKEFEFVMGSKKALRSREERSGNIVSIEPYDNTSNAYYRETPKRAQTGFGAYLTVALIVFLVVLFLGIYDFFLQIWKAFA
jgi:hypothetical protein